MWINKYVTVVAIEEDIKTSGPKVMEHNAGGLQSHTHFHIAFLYLNHYWVESHKNTSVAHYMSGPNQPQCYGIIKDG